MLDELSINQCAIESDYTPLTVRTDIKLGKLQAQLIRVRNRPTYVIKRADFEGWLETKDRTVKAGV